MFRKLILAGAASAVALGVAGVPGTAAAHATATASPQLPVVAQATASAKKDNKNEHVIFVHGYNDTKNCNDWNNMKKYFKKKGWKGSKLHTWGYYSGVTNCDNKVKYNKNTSLAKVANSLAKHIYKKYTSKGKQVNVVAHSMGGLVIRRAIIGPTASKPGYNGKKLDVRDVVLLGTPNNGSYLDCDHNSWCSKQRNQMNPGSAFQKFMKKMHKKGRDQGKKGTQYTVLGSKYDGVVSSPSARAMTAKYKVSYVWLSSLTHSDLHLRGAGDGFTFHYSKNYGKTYKRVRGGPGPIRAAYLGIRYSNR